MYFLDAVQEGSGQMLSETLTSKPDADSCQSSDCGGGCESPDGCGEPCSSCSTTTIESLRRQVAGLRCPIGFHGRPGIGKTTSAKMLGFPMEAFADPIRVFAAALFGEECKERKDSYDTAFKAIPRVVMQAVGDIVRRVSPEIMIHSLRIRVASKGLKWRTHSIHDVRSVNECKYIRNRGGVVIGLTDDPRGIHNGRRIWFRRGLDWVRGWFVNKLERRIPCDIWVFADRGEDYEWRLLEAILQAHDRKSIPS